MRLLTGQFRKCATRGCSALCLAPNVFCSRCRLPERRERPLEQRRRHKASYRKRRQRQAAANLSAQFEGV